MYRQGQELTERADQEEQAPKDVFPLLNIEELQEMLHTTLIGSSLIYQASIDSTNSLAMNLLQHTVAEGTVILTDHQPGGRGRQGRRWQSLPGQQALLSIMLAPRFPSYFLVMCAALAAREAIALTTDLNPAIKWPNDVLLGGKKVCGILIETTIGSDGQLWAVVGIGLNVSGSFQEDPDLAERATTIAEHSTQPISREATIVALLEQFEEHYLTLQQGSAEGAWHIWKRWREHLATLGQWVRIQQGAQLLEGMAVGVDANGALLVRQADGATTQVTWGDVQMDQGPSGALR